MKEKREPISDAKRPNIAIQQMFANNVGPFTLAGA